MSPALEKLKAKIFSRFTASDLGVILESEIVYGPNRYGSVGGLEYECERGPKGLNRIQAQVLHETGDLFHIYVFVLEYLGHETAKKTRIATPRTKFVNVDFELKKQIQTVRDEN